MPAYKQTESINETELENVSAQSEYQQTERKRNTLSVQHDLLKLEVNKLRDGLSAAASKVMCISECYVTSLPYGCPVIRVIYSS